MQVKLFLREKKMTSTNNQINPLKYKMDHDKRGKALVININKYDPNPFELEEREFSKIDVENLTKTLNYLEFDLDLEENSTKSKIEERLQQIALINHENFDCFLCVVMSHGNESKIVTSDSELISFEEIMGPIKSCQTLFNKPKIFFFQTCRTENWVLEPKGKSTNSTISSRDDQSTEMTSLSSLQSNSNKNNETKFENESDLLIYHLTLPDSLSWNTDKKEGTIFIKSACDVFNDAYKNLPNNNMSLAQMFTKINESVSKNGQQIYEPINRMRKDVYFLPKNVRKNSKFNVSCLSLF